MDTDFGYWFSGLVDGEGCFVISQCNRAGKQPTFSPRFQLALRSDDLPILKLIQENTGLGRLTTERKGYRTSKPQTKWRVYSKEQCFGLIDILEEYPLRSKKAKDFAIWKLAVFNWDILERSPGLLGRYDWSKMSQLKLELESSRSF